MLRASFIIAFSLLASPIAHGADLPNDQVLRRISRNAFPHLVQLLNWNVLKAERGQIWAAEMQEFTKGRNLVTLQEGYEVPAMGDVLRALPGLSFHMSASFAYKGSLTGVITGATSEPSRLDFRRSPDREPILNSPKITGFAWYRLDSGPNAGRELLVANLHGINFVGPDKFRNQIENVAEVIAQHEGPVILAGDFNTWSAPRSEIMYAATRRLGLEEVSFGTGESKKPALDHVFVKGCKVLKAWMPEAVKGSDHLPQFVDLSCGDN